MIDDFNRVLFHPTTIVLWVGLSCLLALGGPYGTYAAPLVDRMAAWSLLVGVGLALGTALRILLRRHLPGLGRWPRAVLKAALLSCVLAPLAVRVTAGLGPAAAHRDGGIALAEAVLGIALLSLSLSALRGLLVRPVMPEADTPPALLERLPADLQGPLIRLTSSDHYVHVVTERGQADLLIRMADAIAQLDGVAGMRVHRSHWVALAAVTGVRRDRGRLFLILRDGSEVPVSRRYRAEVEARGLAPDA